MTSREEVEHDLFTYSVPKAEEFYKQGIYKLVDRSSKVLGSNGGYVND